MTISPFIPGNVMQRRSVDSFVSMRAQLDDLQRQMTTGKRSATSGGLGLDRRVSLDVRGKLASLDGYDENIQQGGFRLKLANQSVERISKLALEAKSDLRPNSFLLGAGGQTPGQQLSAEKLQQSIDALNIDQNGRFLFSGRTTDVRPVETFNLIINGDGAGRAGVKQLISERKLADIGAGQGRLTVASAGTAATIDEEATNPPYGFKIAGAAFSGTGVTPAYTAGPPANLTVNVTGAPNVGDALTVTLNLPDGTKETLTLTARAATTPGTPEDTFAVGATPAATAANIAASLTASLTREAASTLSSASALIASKDFFNGTTTTPPVRVPGPGFATATAPPTNAAPYDTATVIWYKGDDNAAISPRTTGLVQVDQTQNLGTGARANEEAFRITLAQFAATASETYLASDVNASRRYDALSLRVRTNLAFTGGVQKPEDIAVDLGIAQSAMKSAKERHDATRSYLTDALARVEDASQEEVITSITSLQTRLQASYQTTAILRQLTLTNYLR
jgi:flagellar hook-associated protein 3 FlgL